jgi:NADPH:quinone reductase-like Zn-dependent oxidoreductase
MRRDLPQPVAGLGRAEPVSAGLADPLDAVPDVMRAVRLTGHGGLDRLVYEQDVPVPRPQPGEILVAVSACGVNNTDLNTRLGWYSSEVTSQTDAAETPPDSGAWASELRFPRIQGADVVGTVAGHGTGVVGPAHGTRVIIDPWLRASHRSEVGYLGSERDGGFAEYVTVPAQNAHAVSSPLSDVELATFSCSYSTAEHMLERAGVSPGRRVLVTGASGGVGTGLVQIAKARGASVVALTSAAKTEAVSALGADEVIDRNRPDLADAVRASGPFDVFADVVGGPTFPSLFDTMAPEGHYVVSGAVAGPIVSLDLRTVYLRDLTMHGATVVPERVFARLVRRIESDEVRPLVAGTFALADVAEAQRELATRRHVGSFVVTIH